MQVRINLGIADHVWQEKHSAIAATIDQLGAKFKPELRAGWLAYIRETNPDGPAAASDIVGEDTLVLDGWVPDALDLYAHWSHVVDVPIGKFSATNKHPDPLSNFWNNAYNIK